MSGHAGLGRRASETVGGDNQRNVPIGPYSTSHESRKQARSTSAAVCVQPTCSALASSRLLSSTPGPIRFVKVACLMQTQLLRCSQRRRGLAFAGGPCCAIDRPFKVVCIPAMQLMRVRPTRSTQKASAQRAGRPRTHPATMGSETPTTKNTYAGTPKPNAPSLWYLRRRVSDTTCRLWTEGYSSERKADRKK